MKAKLRADGAMKRGTGHRVSLLSAGSALALTAVAACSSGESSTSGAQHGFYGHGQPSVDSRSMNVADPWLAVDLPRSSTIRLTLRLDLRTNQPSYRSPFDA
jgi:hypothetical protein